MAAEDEGGAPLSDAHSEVMGAVNCHATSQLWEHLWDRGSSEGGKCECDSIKAQNDGGLALDQKQTGGRFVINKTFLPSVHSLFLCKV